MLQRALLIATAAAALVSPLAAQNFASAMTVGDREVFIGQPQNDYLPGMVYVYRPDAKGVWREAAKLVAADAATSDGFGRGLAVDGATLLVGSTAADSGRGAVFVFTRDPAGAWRQTGRFTAPDARPEDGFGATITLAGAGDRAYVSSARQKGRGAVYVFRRSGGTWAAETTLAPADTSPNQAFGAAIALDGNRLLVGSTRADSSAGAVYVYGRDSATASWKMEVRVPAPGRGRRAAPASARRCWCAVTPPSSVPRATARPAQSSSTSATRRRSAGCPWAACCPSTARSARASARRSALSAPSCGWAPPAPTASRGGYTASRAIPPAGPPRRSWASPTSSQVPASAARSP